jgi:hypothetical protein
LKGERVGECESDATGDMAGGSRIRGERTTVACFLCFALSSLLSSSGSSVSVSSSVASAASPSAAFCRSQCPDTKPS